MAKDSPSYRRLFVRRHIPDLLTLAVPVLRPLRLLRVFGLLGSASRRAGQVGIAGTTALVVGAVSMVLVVGAGLMLDAERGVVGATEVRGDLAVIVALYAELPAHLPLVPGGALTGSRGGADSPMPGGTVLALLGPGSDGNEGRRLTTSEQAHGVAGREHGVDNKPEDPPSVEWALGTWEQDWRETRGEAG